MYRDLIPSFSVFLFPFSLPQISVLLSVHFVPNNDHDAPEVAPNLRFSTQSTFDPGKWRRHYMILKRTCSVSLIYLQRFERVVSRVGAKVMSFASSSPPSMRLPWRQAADYVCEQSVKAVH